MNIIVLNQLLSIFNQCLYLVLSFLAQLIKFLFEILIHFCTVVNSFLRAFLGLPDCVKQLLDLFCVFTVIHF